MAGPRVSVVMPTYNYGRFIGAAIEGFLAQSFRDFELIIVDDASTDDTLGVVSRYDDGRIVVVRREVSACSPDTPRNDGLAVARGELIAIADADDVSVPNRLALQVGFLDRQPEVGLLGGALIPTDERLYPVGRISRRPVYGRPGMYRRTLLNDQGVLANPTMMFRRSVLDRLSGYNDYASSGDFEFILRASRYFNLYNLEAPLIYYRQHPRSVTRSYGALLSAYHHAIFMFREYLWVRKEAEWPEAQGGRVRTVCKRASGPAVSSPGRPFVSVVLAGHNCAGFIGRTIESILRQTYPHFELIVVDDASTDETLNVVSRYDDERLAVVRRGECSCGGYVAWNDGLAVARGDLIAMAGAGDRSVPDRLASQVGFLEAYPEVDVVSGTVVQEGVSGRPGSMPVYDRGQDYRLALLRGAPALCLPVAMFRRRVLDRVGGFNDYVISGGREFLLRVSRYFRLHNLGHVLGYSRGDSGPGLAGFRGRIVGYHHKIYTIREYLWLQREIRRRAV